MKYMYLLVGFMLIANSLFSCDSKTMEHKQGNITVFIEQGKEWKHDFPLFWGIKIRIKYGMNKLYINKIQLILNYIFSLEALC